MPRPHVTLKLATSLDGKIALKNGVSEWITNEKSRAEGRKLRAAHEAIAIGANTAVLDNPQLTARIDGKADPLRVVFDTHLRLSEKSNLALTAKDVPVWVFTSKQKGEEFDTLTKMGVKILPVPHIANEGLDIDTALDVLRRQGISRLLLEGGGTLAASFVKRGFVDRIAWFRAPLILGGDGRSGIGELGLETLDMARRFERVDLKTLGTDVYENYERIK